MTVRFRDARLIDVPMIAAVQNAAAGALTANFGAGSWSSLVNERYAELMLRHARVRVGRGRGGRRLLWKVQVRGAGEGEVQGQSPPLLRAGTRVTWRALQVLVLVPLTTAIAP